MRFIFTFVLFMTVGGLANSLKAQSEIKLTASDLDQYEAFGSIVSISGSYAIIGRSGDDHNGYQSGSAYVFKIDGSNWVEQAKLLPSDGAEYEQFGVSVSISGSHALIGAPTDVHNDIFSGSAYVFRREGEAWVEEAKLVPSDAEAEDKFGYALSLSGDYALIGAFANEDNGHLSGSAYVFKRDGSNWVEQAKLIASDANNGDNFGHSVSISGDYALIGAFGNDDDGGLSGSAYVFKRDGSNWVEQAKLTASDAEGSDQFGHAVSIDGDYVLVGAEGNGDHGARSGSAYVFRREETTWIEEAKLTASDADKNDIFGSEVSINGDYALLGAWRKTNNGGPQYAGAAYVFKRDGSNWVEQAKLVSSEPYRNSAFGSTVSFSGNYAFVGSPGSSFAYLYLFQD